MPQTAPSETEIDTSNVYVPDYTQKCSNCGETPVVTIRTKDDKLVHDFEMCGCCCFGEAACIDPEEW